MEIYFMVDYLKEIDNGLMIEEPKIVLSWKLHKKDFFDMTDDISVINENYCTLKIKLSGISFINCVGLHFEKERLSKIDLFNDEKCFSESEIADIFYEHQLVLETLFGKPSGNCLLDKFKGVCKEYKWKFKYVTIIHKLWDRFGMEENLNILINSW
jgi:hypothetical protein